MTAKRTLIEQGHGKELNYFRGMKHKTKRESIKLVNGTNDGVPSTCDSSNYFVGQSAFLYQN